MEPIGNADPGPNAILVGLDPDEFQRRLAWAFDRVPLAAGVNNHMGSRATSDPASMLKVLQEVRRRGLSFVDSRTSPLSVGDGLAAQLGIPHAARDVFLDNVPTTGAILAPARRSRAAGPPARPRTGHRASLPGDAGRPRAWMPAAEARGLRIVRAGDLIARSRCGQPQALHGQRLHRSGLPAGPRLLRRAQRAPLAKRTASSAARISARALLQLSWYSASGSLSATTPPPAWTYMRPSLTSAVRSAMQVSMVPSAREIADGAGVEAAPLGLQLVDDLHRPHLGRAADRAGREARHQRVERVAVGPDAALDVRDDVHDVASSTRPSSSR